MIKNTILGIIIFTMCGCTSNVIDQYSHVEPKLDIFDFFQGELTASGIVRKRSGKVIRHFNATIEATTHNNILTLHEEFLFSDGEHQTRIWKIQRIEDNTFSGTASDIPEEAQGHSSGNALQWKYNMLLETNGRKIKVNFDDWMFQTSDNTIINVSDIKKWGFKVADVVLVIQKVDSTR